MYKKHLFTIVACVLNFLLGTFPTHGQLNENLYPLIQNVNGRVTQSLNGKWQVIVDPFENGYYDHRFQPKADGYFTNQKPENKWDRVEYDFENSELLTVPGDWNTQKEKLFYYEGTIWYKKDFELKKSTDNRVFLHFGAVNYEAIVYLNGLRIGKHTGGFTPFNFEVSDKIRSGSNTLIIKVDNKRKSEAVPTVNTDWWNYGGITRNVSLVTLPETFIRDYSLQIDGQNPERISGYILTDGLDEDQAINIRIPQLNVSETVKATSSKTEFEIKADPELWTPDQPVLYRVEIKTESDSIIDALGFRTIEVNGPDILLNDRSIFLKGVCIHEEAPFRSGRAYSSEDAKILLEWAKSMGCNFVRLAHYPHNEYMMREADRLGLMVWSEIPVYWTIAWGNQETLVNAKNQLSESMERDKNRASIIIWSVANETPVSDDRLKFLKELIDHTRTLDSTRLVSAASDTHGSSEDTNLHVISDPLAAYLDVIGVNYYCGWYQGLPEICGDQKWKNPYNKPVILSEFGGGALQGFHGDTLTRWSEEYQESVYLNNFKMIQHMDFLRGTTPWLLMDFYSSRRPLPRIQDNYNRKGVISETGQKKKAFYTIQNFYQSFSSNPGQ